jgi:hypothetical protein
MITHNQRRGLREYLSTWWNEMPLPCWAILGAVIYPRPREPNVRVLIGSSAIIVYAVREEVQLNSNNVVFSVDSETLERNWMPLSEAEPLFSESYSGMIYAAGEPELVGIMPIRTDLTVIPKPTTEWMQTGCRLQSISDEGPNAVIVGNLGGTVHIREVEHCNASLLVLSTRVRSITPEQLLELYRPLTPPMPSWFSIGSRIIQNHDNQTYIVLSFDPIRWLMSATLEDEHHPTNFSVNDFIRHWRPASSITEQRPSTSVTNIAQSRAEVAPEWLVPGVFLRRSAPPRYEVVVSSLDSRLFIARLTRISSLKPLVFGSVFEEVAYCCIDEQFTLIDEFGSPTSEYTCPKCKGLGARDFAAEERRDSIDRVRAYTCNLGHTWYFSSGTEQDGKPANPSRFERDIGI